MLVVRDLHVYYGDSHVIQGASLRVERGQAVALLGRNGAGKTTMIHSVAGFVQPRRGSVELEDEAIQHLPTYAVARRGVGIVPQGRRLFGDLTARENLVLAARRRPHGEYQWGLEEIYQLFPRLRERERTAAGQLSGGEQQMLAIGRALMTNPKLLLLDEPSEGLAPMLVRQVGDVLQSLRQRGLTILLVEQNLALAVAVADRVYIMNKGRIVFEDAAGGLLADEEVKSRWLGV